MSTPWPAPHERLDDLVDGFWMWGIDENGLYHNEAGTDEEEDDDVPIHPEREGVWCPLFRHAIGITERNTGVCRFCAAEGLQEAPA